MVIDITHMPDVTLQNAGMYNAHFCFMDLFHLVTPPRLSILSKLLPTETLLTQFNETKNISPLPSYWQSNVPVSCFPSHFLLLRVQCPAGFSLMVPVAHTQEIVGVLECHCLWKNYQRTENGCLSVQHSQAHIKPMLIPTAGHPFRYSWGRLHNTHRSWSGTRFFQKRQKRAHNFCPNIISLPWINCMRLLWPRYLTVISTTDRNSTVPLPWKDWF